MAKTLGITESFITIFWRGNSCRQAMTTSRESAENQMPRRIAFIYCTKADFAVTQMN